MKKFIFLADVILRFLFMVLAWYFYTNYSADNKMKWVGLSMVAFNIITMFFDSNYHKSKKKTCKSGSSLLN
ncbi:hypothetical protein QI18_05520 [Lactococcus lactis subsp. lactis]|nr:hypothetical protein QI18_05520 [Lactococcus lactis subsp. lactis]